MTSEHKRTPERDASPPGNDAPSAGTGDPAQAGSLRPRPAQAGQALRQRAEETLREQVARSAETLETLSPDEAQRTLHELRVHQIELEMQNEELRRAQVELDASRARYFDLYDCAPVGYCSVSETGLIMEANLTAATLLGAARGALVKQPFSRVIFKEDQDICYLLRKKLIETGEPQACELRMVKEDGTAFWARLEATAAVDDVGAPVLRVVLSDVTERRQAEAARAALEAQLRASQKLEALGTLAGGVAHGFNNALAVIMGNVELAREDVGTAHPALESLAEIDKASRRAKNLAQQILAFGRRQVLERKVMSLAPVVEESARLLRATQPAGMRLDVECAPDAPAVLADATQIQQVLLNLCSNAWQAMKGRGRTGRIQIRLEAYDQAPSGARDSEAIPAYGALRPGRYACLCVRDNGRGMDEATQARLFEPFFTTKSLGEGAGLGLSVVHGIAQEHQASVQVQSKSGEGTAFRIYFPAATSLSSSVPAQGRQPVGERDAGALLLPAEGKHILYVDDDESIVFLMTRLLERKGFRVSGYTDQYEALAVVRANPDQFDLVVTDYNLPGMSGLEVARALREIRADLPIVMTSGYSTAELRAQAPAAGVSELVFKPNTVDELCEAVGRLAHAQRENEKDS